MRAASFEEFGAQITVGNVDDPAPPVDGVVIRVEANGICRSDWHGWMGHDPLVNLPHVPGHELAGVIEEVGPDVRHWRAGQRVTVPFSCGCGHCNHCRSGESQICDSPYQPGFAGWGSFAELVAIPKADTNLIAIPDRVSPVQAAGLGCRFATAYRAVVFQGAAQPGEFMAVHGCGGLGLSAIAIGAAIGARPVAIDINPDALELATTLGAEHCINANSVDRVATAVRDLTAGGAQLSLDTYGSRETCVNSVMSLAKHGRHVQVGLMLGQERKATIPMPRVISWELTIRGSFGLAASAYPLLLSMIEAGRLDPGMLVQRLVNLEQGADVLMRMDQEPPTGVTVITQFD